jgi:hypothetical protein
MPDARHLFRITLDGDDQQSARRTLGRFNGILAKPKSVERAVAVRSQHQEI